jgi:hypothetical protein
LIRVGYDWGDEAIPQPALQVRWRNTVLLVRFTDTNEARVESIEIEGSDIATATGDRVGMLVDSLVLRRGLPEFAEGECVLYMGWRQKAPGIGYRLALPESYGRDCGNLEPPTGEFPRGARIERVSIFRPDVAPN